MKFIPFVSDSTIVEKYSKNNFSAKLTVNYGIIRDSYISKVKVDPLFIK